MVKIRQTNIQITDSSEDYIVSKGEEALEKLSKLNYKASITYNISIEHNLFVVSLQDGSYCVKVKKGSLFKSVNKATNDFVKKVKKESSKRISKKRKEAFDAHQEEKKYIEPQEEEI